MSDSRTVTVKDPTGKRHKVTPEVARVAVAKRGFELVGAPAAKDDTAKAVEAATAPLKARIAELEAELADTKSGEKTEPAKPEAPKAKTEKEG